MRVKNKDRYNRIVKIIKDSKTPLNLYEIAKKLSDIEKKKIDAKVAKVYVNSIINPKLYSKQIIEHNRIKILYSFNSFPNEISTINTENIQKSIEYYKYIETAFAYVQNNLIDDTQSVSQQKRIMEAWNLILKGLGYAFGDENMSEDEIMDKLLSAKELLKNIGVE